MVIKVNRKIVYGSWKDGSDIYKDSKGYYVIQWDPLKNDTYNKYLPKSWKPFPEDSESDGKSTKVKTTKKRTKRNKTKRNKKG
jgi:hypothetical protein